jgi:hypothetical protein
VSQFIVSCEKFSCGCYLYYVIKEKRKCLKIKVWVRKRIARREAEAAYGKLLRELNGCDEIFDKKFALIPLLLFSKLL